MSVSGQKGADEVGAAQAVHYCRMQNSTPSQLPYTRIQRHVHRGIMVLKSPRAIQMSVHVVRAFAHLRSAVHANAQVMRQLEQLEARVGKHDGDIAAILTAMKALVTPAERTTRGIGFLADIK